MGCIVPGPIFCIYVQVGRVGACMYDGAALQSTSPHCIDINRFIAGRHYRYKQNQYRYHITSHTGHACHLSPKMVSDMHAHGALLSKQV